MSKFKPPAPPFIQARWSGGAQTPKRIVIHSTVSATEEGGARRIARYFATTDTKASAHYCVDPGEVIQCVGDKTVAYHCGHNQDSIAIEFCDMPEQSKTRWARKPHKKMERRAAKLAAELCLAYDIPVVFLGAAALRAGSGGITTHALMSEVYKKSTHWDPGGWERVRFMKRVRKIVNRRKRRAKLIPERIKKLRTKLRKVLNKGPKK